MSTMGELNYRFERAVFAALSYFDRWQHNPECNFARYDCELREFVRLCADIRSTLDITEYEKKLEEFEERFN